MRPAPTDLDALAHAKLARVLGPQRAEEELARVCEALGISAIASVDDLERVARVLRGSEGFVSTVGALLAVETAMRRLRAK